MTSASETILGVEIKDLKTFPDQRGFFREIFRHNEAVFSGGKFGQWSHSHMGQGVVKAWHYHHKQTDWWYVPIGLLKVVLIDNREESPTFRARMEFLLGAGEQDAKCAIVRIPPGVLHGARVLSHDAHLFYITSETYDPADEGRIPFNDSEIGYDWGENPIVSQRDTEAHTPPYSRQLIS